MSLVCVVSVSTVGQQSSPLCVAEDVAAAAAASDGQWAIQRPGTRREWPPRDARAQLSSPTLPASARRSGVGPRGYRERTWNPQRYWGHTAADNDYYRPKFGRGTSKVSHGYASFLFKYCYLVVLPLQRYFVVLLCRLRLAVTKFPELHSIA